MAEIFCERPGEACFQLVVRRRVALLSFGKALEARQPGEAPTVKDVIVEGLAFFLTDVIHGLAEVLHGEVPIVGEFRFRPVNVLAGAAYIGIAHVQGNHLGGRESSVESCERQPLLLSALSPPAITSTELLSRS